MSLNATRQEIEVLYRRYIHLLNEWPTGKIRPNRDMKQALATRVEETFWDPLDNTKETFDPIVAKTQLDALERILGNHFKQKYPLSRKTLNPAGNPNYYSTLLSSLDTTDDGKIFGLKRFFSN